MTTRMAVPPMTSVPASRRLPSTAGSVLTANWKSQFHVGRRP
jgi:hypothetical protein